MTPPLLEAKGTGGHNLGIIHFTYCSYHAFTLMSTPCIVLSKQYFVPPLAKKRGGGFKKNFSARFARRICPPTFKTVAPPLTVTEIFLLTVTLTVTEKSVTEITLRPAVLVANTESCRPRLLVTTTEHRMSATSKASADI